MSGLQERPCVPAFIEIMGEGARGGEREREQEQERGGGEERVPQLIVRLTITSQWIYPSLLLPHPSRNNAERRRSAQGLQGTSLTRNILPLGPCSRPMPRALWWS